MFFKCKCTWLNIFFHLSRSYHIAIISALFILQLLVITDVEKKERNSENLNHLENSHWSHWSSQFSGTLQEFA